MVNIYNVPGIRQSSVALPNSAARLGLGSRVLPAPAFSTTRLHRQPSAHLAKSHSLSSRISPSRDFRVMSSRVS